MKARVFFEMNATGAPVRSSSMNVTPPDVPMPGMAGGGKANAAEGFASAASSLLIFFWIASTWSSGVLRFAHSSSVMKKKPVYVL